MRENDIQTKVWKFVSVVENQINKTMSQLEVNGKPNKNSDYVRNKSVQRLNPYFRWMRGWYESLLLQKYKEESRNSFSFAFVMKWDSTSFYYNLREASVRYHWTFAKIMRFYCYFSLVPKFSDFSLNWWTHRNSCIQLQ